MGGREKGKLEKAEQKREKVGPHLWARILLGNQTARTHARTDETKRNDFLVELAHILRYVWTFGINGFTNCR